MAELAISLYLPEETTASTVRMGRTVFVSKTGDFTKAATLADAEKTTTLAFLSGLYVTAAPKTGVIVTVGNSITDGAASTPHSYNAARY